MLSTVDKIVLFMTLVITLIKAKQKNLDKTIILKKKNVIKLNAVIHSWNNHSEEQYIYIMIITKEHETPQKYHL